MWLRRLRGSSGAGSTPVDGQTIRWQSERLARLFAVAIVPLLAMPCTEAITSAVTVALRRHGEKIRGAAGCNLLTASVSPQQGESRATVWNTMRWAVDAGTAVRAADPCERGAVRRTLVLPTRNLAGPVGGA